MEVDIADNIVTLASVVLGGGITLAAQALLVRRDETRRSRETRTDRYEQFLRAWRDYLRYLSRRDIDITTMTRTRPPHDLLPVFGPDGATYAEHLERSKTVMRLVAHDPDVIEASRVMVKHARTLASTRAHTHLDALPAELFEACWHAQDTFIDHARAELGRRAIKVDRHSASVETLERR